MEVKSACWVHKDFNYGGAVISHECHCSNCGYVAMRYSHMIYDFRAGKPFSMPNYNYCPNCGKNMEGTK
jgi:ribosomal protein L32